MPAEMRPHQAMDRNQMIAQMRINEMILYVQEHLEQRMTLEELASVAGYSPFHVHRIFHAFVGETLGDFIQRLRMGRALDALINSQQSITDIALQSGYQTPAAFSKAFKQLFRTTPSQVRKTGQRPGMFVNPLEIGPEIRRIKMQVEIRELPAKKVLTVTRKGLIEKNFNKAAHDAFTVLTRFISTNRIWGLLEEGCLGICPDDGVEVPPEESRYIAGYFLKDGSQVWARGEVEEMELPAGRVAVFVHKGPYESLWQTWNKIYRDWLPTSGE
jgi:AraC family transcriptional regulator